MLKRKTPLKTKTSLRDSYAGKARAKSNPKRPLKRSSCASKRRSENLKNKKSVLTADMGRCFVCGDTQNIHIHHVFGAANRHNSEKYGFLVPLRADWHNMSDHGVHFNKEFDLRLKRLCQEYWLKNYGDREDFIAVFGKWW